MTAGLAAMTEVLTDEKLVALNRRGDTLRTALNDLLRPVGAQATGTGSILTVHFTSVPVRNGADAAKSSRGLGELFFLEMLHRGIHLARRGMVALSLPVGDKEMSAFLAAVEQFTTDHRDLLTAGGDLSVRR